MPLDFGPEFSCEQSMPPRGEDTRHSVEDLAKPQPEKPFYQIFSRNDPNLVNRMMLLVDSNNFGTTYYLLWQCREPALSKIY